MNHLLFVGLLILGGIARAAQWQLEVANAGDGSVEGVFWSNGQQRREALSENLLEVVKKEKNRLLVSEKVEHALVVVPTDTDEAPLGDVVILLPGEKASFAKRWEGLLKSEPNDVRLSRSGFFFTIEIGRKFSVGHYDIRLKKIEIFKELSTAMVGKDHQIELREDAAVITTSGRSQEFHPGGKTGSASVNYVELGSSNRDLLIGQFQGVNLTERAKNGLLSPSPDEIDLVSKMADNIRRNNNQKSILISGEEGADLRGALHLFVQRVSEARQTDIEFGWFREWEIYEIPWSSFNTEGLVDKGAEKARKLCDAIRNKKVILVIEQIEALVGLGVSQNEQRDIASVFQSFLKNGEVIVIGTSSAEGRPTLEGRRDFKNLFSEIRVAGATPEKLLVKAKYYAESKREESRVHFSDEVLKSIIDLTNRYQPEKGQPQKMYDAIEAIASIHSPKPREEGEAAPFVNVTEEKVRYWLSQVTRIGTIAEDGMVKLRKYLVDTSANGFSARMQKELIGQTKAHEAIRGALLTIASSKGKTGLKGEEVGMKTLFFTGPSGTGKSYAPKVLAKVLKEHGVEFPLEEIDGAALGSDDTQSERTILGAGPGFAGYAPEGGLLYQKVKRSPQAILLLDEFDKMNPNIHKSLYSFLEDGKTTNASGSTAYFNRGLFIMTANYGVEGVQGRSSKLCDYIDRWDRYHLFPAGDPLHREAEKDNEGNEIATWDKETLRQKLLSCLKDKKLVNPQVLGRIGRSNFVVFHHFTKDQLRSLMNSELAKLVKEYQGYGAQLSFSEDFKAWLLDHAWGSDGEIAFALGARAILNTIEVELSEPLNNFFVEIGVTTKGELWEVVLDGVRDGRRAKIQVQNPSQGSGK